MLTGFIIMRMLATVVPLRLRVCDNHPAFANAELTGVKIQK